MDFLAEITSFHFGKPQAGGKLSSEHWAIL